MTRIVANPEEKVSQVRDRYGRIAAGEIEILRDVDYLESMLATMPEEVEALLARPGTKLETLKGTVRSVTYRARPGKATLTTPTGITELQSCCGTDCCGGGKR